ncbi:hypothetical protein [Sphingomonas colocasiae]|uniref:Uncharacterized protein n=1 Tax=Sphingomonas colocasiae TaxID=1848973 RepID=A0ABS7PXN5_9SPHN|nr:hypothetical protein [Sphingomonas colocasiae]MBY8826119.1 hypothetical protein [Sphingomonas colocasiae]
MSGIAVMRALLLASDPLVAKVPADRVVAGDLPKGTVIPAITIEQVSSVDRRPVRMMPVQRVTDRVQVTVHAQDAVERLKLIGLVRRAAAGKLGDFDLVARVSVQTDGQGPDFTGPTGIKMRAQDFMVSYNEETSVAAAPVHDEDALALWARRSVAATDAEMAADDEYIRGLKEDGIWAKLDLLKIRPQRDEQAARLDYVNAAFDDIAVNSPTFLRGQGFIGDQIAAYLDSGFDPAAYPSAKYKAADAHLGVWLGTDISSGTQFDVGHSRAMIAGRNGAVAIVRSNQTAALNVALAVPTSIGFFCWTRRDANGFWTVKDDGVPVYSAQVAAGISLNQTLLSLAARTSGGVPANFSGRLQLAMMSGAGLTDLDLANFHARTKRRLQLAGAI